ncbi:MAG: hypothetical protein J5838_00945 [Desulfovibrio sp.]|nr:hypothetical protein [Desulfovibrio sp.]
MRIKTFVSLMSVFLFIFSLNTAIAKPVAYDVKEYKEHGEIDKIRCDSTKTYIFHLGDFGNFYVDFTAKNNKVVKVTDVNYWFWADKDYNGDEGIFQLKPTKEIEKADWIVKNKEIRLVESSDYKIKSLPDTPSDENIIFKAEILFNEIMPDGSISPEQERIVQCVRASVRK